jgi:hypothetical protein
MLASSALSIIENNPTKILIFLVAINATAIVVFILQML